MSTARAPIGRPSKSRIITAEMIELFRRAAALHAKQDDWEEDGGTRRQFFDVSRDLHSLMGRHPHQENVCAVIGQDEPPEWMQDDARRVTDFKQAVALRRQLERLAEERACLA